MFTTALSAIHRDIFDSVHHRLVKFCEAFADEMNNRQQTGVLSLFNNNFQVA